MKPTEPQATPVHNVQDNAAAELEQVLHRDIPLTQEMGIRVIDWQNHRLRLHLPLAPNVNHKSTLFGGSLYCGAVLAGWGWLHLRLREAGITDGHIVIQDGQISYPLPVRDDAVALCEAPQAAQWDKFIATYQRRGRARLVLHTSISAQDSDEQAVKFVGQFVLHR